MVFHVEGKAYKPILNEIDAHVVVSFDMFDTLVKRDCWRPVELFHFVEKKVDSAFGVHNLIALYMSQTCLQWDNRQKLYKISEELWDKEPDNIACQM